MASLLDIEEGVYDKTKRYIVNNWSNEDFTQLFGAETAYNGDKIIQSQPAYSIKIKSGEMRELGQFEALTFTKHFVTREMYKVSSKLKGKAREGAETSVNNGEARKPYEDKTVKEIKPGEATPFMDKLREEIRAEEIAKLNPVVSETSTPEVKLDKRTKEYKEKAGEFEGTK